MMFWGLPLEEASKAVLVLTIFKYICIQNNDGSHIEHNRLIKNNMKINMIVVL